MHAFKYKNQRVQNILYRNALQEIKYTDDDSKKYDAVRQKFEGVKRRNVIFERAKFNNRRQEPGEPVEPVVEAQGMVGCRPGIVGVDGD